MERMQPSADVEVIEQKPKKLSPSEIRTKLGQNTEQYSAIVQRMNEENISTEDFIKLHNEMLEIAMEGDALLDQLQGRPPRL